MAKRSAGSRNGSSRASANATPPPPAPPPASDKPPLWWRVVSGIPGWGKGLLGLVAAVGTALAVIYTFIPANLELTLSQCRPELVRLDVVNTGGRAATLGDAQFEMISTVRFGNADRNAMTEDGLNNPIRDHRELARNEAISYEWLNVFQPEETAEGETCHIYVTVPLLNDPSRTFSKDCSCSAG
jgi:hypothetical protein